MPGDISDDSSPRSARQEFWLVFARDRLAIAGLIVLVVLAITAVFGKVLTEWVLVFDPATVRLVDKFRPLMSAPSPALAPEDLPVLGVYVLGTDEFGRDVLARMLQGAFVSLSIGFIAMGIAMVIGVTLGALAGYFGQHRLGIVSVDTLIMRFTDVMLCFPVMFLILTVVAVLPASIYNIMVVIGMTGWMGTARFVRAEFLSLKEQDFVRAAIAMGLPTWRIVFIHILPNAMAPVLVTATITVAYAILAESSLSFLGFGVQPPFATWGNILSDGKGYIFDAPWLFYIPGLAIFTVVLAFTLVGEGLREALNPKLRRK